MCVFFTFRPQFNAFMIFLRFTTDNTTHINAYGNVHRSVIVQERTNGLWKIFIIQISAKIITSAVAEIKIIGFCILQEQRKKICLQFSMRLLQYFIRFECIRYFFRRMEISFDYIRIRKNHRDKTQTKKRHTIKTQIKDFKNCYVLLRRTCLAVQRTIKLSRDFLNRMWKWIETKRFVNKTDVSVLTLSYILFLCFRLELNSGKFIAIECAKSMQIGVFAFCFVKFSR